MRFYQFVLKNIARRPVRSILTVVAMAIAVAVLVAEVGITSGFEQSFLSIYQQRKVDLIVHQAGAKPLTSALDTGLEKEIAAIPGVKRVYSGLVDTLTLEELGPLPVVVQGWPADSRQFDEVTMLVGERLHEGDTKEVLLGKTLAESLQKKVGDKLPVFENEQFKVKGIYEGYNVFYNGGMVMMLEDLQRFMGRKGQVNGFTVVVDPPTPENIQRVQKQIEALGKNLAVTPPKELVSSTNEIMLVQAMAWITSAIALVIGTVLILIVMITSVFERTREIGILRAIGWAPGRIVRMILLESVLLSLSGGVAGTVLAILLTQVLSRMPAVAGMISNRIPPSVIGQGMVIALLVGLIGAAYPAYRGSRLLPTEAIRHE